MAGLIGGQENVKLIRIIFYMRSALFNNLVIFSNYNTETLIMSGKIIYRELIGTEKKEQHL